MLSVPPLQPQREQRAGDRQRHGQHDDEGIDEALELRREHEIDEGEREQEGQVACPTLASWNSRDWPL